MSLSTDEWVASAQAALLEDAPVPFKVACLPEYRRRLLGIAAACAGWSRASVEPLWPWVDWASECFEREDAAGWLGALAELERFTGVAGSD
jgi:hypothetical protein